MRPQYVDCHIHLQDARIGKQLNALLDRGRKAGVTRFVCNGTNENDWPDVLKLAHDHHDVIPCFGLHPWHATSRTEEWLTLLEHYLRKIPSAVGEIGLDHWIEPRSNDDQQEVFLAQMALARKLNRPVAIHCLRAWDSLMEILRNEPPVPRGFHLHAFGGPDHLLSELISMGAFFSFPGTILNPDRSKQRRSVAFVPADRLLSETDAPDMSGPTKLLGQGLLDDSRKRISEPADLPLIVNELANLQANRHKSDQRALTERIYANARDFYGSIW